MQCVACTVCVYRCPMHKLFHLEVKLLLRAMDVLNAMEWLARLHFRLHSVHVTFPVPALVPALAAFAVLD